ncbi:50S ribosomal protein L11 methyltransferase [Bdellovibrionota bacterium FG-1]
MRATEAVGITQLLQREMSQATYVLRLAIPQKIQVEESSLDREEFYAWLWQEFGSHGLQGVHEGTLLCEDAAQAGLEAEAWTVDSGEAPRERDWMAAQEIAEAELYFGTQEQAMAAQARLQKMPELVTQGIHEQKAEDWDAQWKASFLANPGGVQVQPFWRILPPWVSASQAGVTPGDVVLRINPGAGFGTGTHETTQMCLQALGECSLRRPLKGTRVLDFGSGSGILSVGAALLGAQVQGVEVDLLAIDNAIENAQLNDVAGRITYSQTLEASDGVSHGHFQVVIANILKPVLLEFASELVARVQRPGGTLILSGLIEKDVDEVATRYAGLLGGQTPLKRELGEWRALVWECL